ncbi:MAG: hypothetical protein KC544_13045 [Gemmatimonadetes bacterium]|nr:hypothetical protein [Gemmatimonadota bacterium]
MADPRMLLSALALVVLPLTLAAQGRETPEAAGRTVLEAIWRGNYLEAARATDPANLRQTRQLFDSVLTHGQATYVAQRLFQLPDSAALLALDDAAFTAGLFRFQWLLRRGGEYMKSVVGVDIAGVAQEGRDTAHVVYRWRFPPDSLPLQSYNVQTVVRCGELWCANALSGFRNILEILRAPGVQVPITVIPPRPPPTEEGDP